ncbi:uncharacterized protein LOC124190248 [Daphnia pulex]|uniref:uncharacterized protein LOC124190248 n=1 Tax=Daphnia pulex TaxID=6669 RepID=UPI001EDD29FE|nr:uncharacterized protein LOC124190248 [Daphnia pulex]XP_046438801.1 uncharacterized protein LOC124190248 [Daphnia pulex]XP_046438802.1 uncharacterized protein LOC124190248 [Daphnia pulex]XP_046438803.1 uncharacterized protein LOC124190248 [Daphnia pulex]XP_046438804.1 uncharacterized protein LOC124190248 [Daphnia pulex]XP_046438805.1 uncharacterized protein LOC124190248 [Daphnia pulex]
MRLLKSFVDACGVPPFKKIMCQFHALISELLHKLNKSDEIDFLKMGFPENILNEMKRMSYLFFGMAEWLLKRRIEIEKMCSLLKDTNLRMYDLSEIDALEPMANDKFALVFLLKMDYVKDPLLTRMQEFIGIQDSSLELPVFAILSLSEHHFEDMKKKLKAFSSESSFNTNTRSLIALVPPSYPANDGEIKEYSYKSNNINHEPPVISSSSVSTLVLCDEKSFDSIQSNHQQKAKSAKDEFQRVITKTNHIPTEADILNLSLSSDSKDVEIVPINEGSLMKTENLEQNSMKQSSDPMDLLKENSNGMLLHSDNQNHVEARTDYSTDESHHCQYKKTKESVADRIGKGQLHNLKGKPDNMPVKAETARMQTIPRKANSSSCQQEESAIVDQDQGSTMAIDSNTVDQRSKPIERSIPDAEKKKIAELFTQEEFAKLIKDGQPMVYQLNTKERPVGENLRYFDIKGQTETISSLKNSQNRKVIILMGATGSGKSTLINGMINYILGVQWKDPFRFKCVREDSSVVRNEAHSQTDSVTAYTLHHREGMAIPYSITLIDTPGYGDTRGIERDKEITKCIHLFLTQQQEIQIDQIHAICFVAASADSRLTPTQRYVLDSVLSIFGEDVKENIRLLVTFADNAIPPVVEACRAAHFPMTSPSDDVMYNKFNSSVLYASNDKKNERIKETMWNMGQRNYKTFFTMLESMNGCDLKSTRQVIENRQLLEKSLPDIEVELEICFDTIEKLKNRSLHGISYARKFTAMEKSQGLDTAIAKAMSLLNEVNKSGRVLNSVALRSHSSSAVDYLSLIRSRVIEEQRPGYQIRLQTLTELQNLLKGNAKTEVPRSQTSHQSSNSRLNAALTNEISGYSGQRTNVGRRNSEDVVAGDAFQQSTAGATDTKIIQSTETMPSSSASYDKTKHIKNPRGGAEGPSNMENPMQPCSANNEDVKKPTDFSSQSSSDPAECGSCRII